jgi:hypothetical protein
MEIGLLQQPSLPLRVTLACAALVLSSDAFQVSKQFQVQNSFKFKTVISMVLFCFVRKPVLVINQITAITIEDGGYAPELV